MWRGLSFGIVIRVVGDSGDVLALQVSLPYSRTVVQEDGAVQPVLHDLLARLRLNTCDDALWFRFSISVQLSEQCTFETMDSMAVLCMHRSISIGAWCALAESRASTVVRCLLLELLSTPPKFQHITPILKYLHWLEGSERIEYKIISLTKFSILLSHSISMSLYLFSLLTVTTHALHLMSLSSNHHHHSKSLTAPSDMLRLWFARDIWRNRNVFCLIDRFTSSLEPASYITQDYSSKLLIPLSATFILNMPV